MDNTSASSASDTLQGGKLGIATPPQPFSQAQPAPSVITRMLQNQQNSQSYANSPNINSKFYGPPGSTTLPEVPPTTTNTFVGNLPGKT